MTRRQATSALTDAQKEPGGKDAARSYLIAAELCCLLSSNVVAWLDAARMRKLHARE